MEKILKALLEAKYPKIDINNLMKVVNTTPNPLVATEILCGLYETPVIPQYPANHEWVDETAEFMSYDKWSGKVTYKYMKKSTKSSWFPRDIDKTTITLENFDSLKVPYGENTIHISINTGEMEEDTDICTLSRWTGKSKWD